MKRVFLGVVAVTALFCSPAKADTTDTLYLRTLALYLQNSNHPYLENLSVERGRQSALEYGHVVCEKYAEGHTVGQFLYAISNDPSLGRDERAESIGYFVAIHLAATENFCRDYMD